MKLNLPILLGLGAILSAGNLTAGEFRPGEVWLDVDGQPIQAHGGGILIRSNVYYWHGEDRTPGTRGGVACYSSTNLSDWKREGLALTPAALQQEGSGPRFVERPKVICNPRTGKYVMWMHLEQRGYRYARGGVAVSDHVAGPFSFVHAIRPITNDFGFNANDQTRQKEFGGTFRDMNAFVDDDGKGYVLYASEDNWTMYIVRLNEEFTGPELPIVENKTWARAFVRKMREAPAPFKHQGRYYMITSGCTGWTPNEAEYATADNILGPWKAHGNPCVGPEAKTTFRSQSTFVIPAPGKPGRFIFMGDRWQPQQLSDSRYVWLPFTIQADGSFTIEWKGKWDLAGF